MRKLDMARKLESKAMEGQPAAADPWRPSYHVTPPVGWMNDPNGFSFRGGEAHLFFQYNPYAPKWGPMHWGHVTTVDFISWKRLPAALAPDKWYDLLMGCFSGTAIVLPNAGESGAPGAGEPDTSDGEADGRGDFVLMYTGVSVTGRQQQCLATSRDGIDFVKERANPVIPTRALPSRAWKGAFRDPKVFRRDGAYWCLVGTQEKRKRTGMLLLYRSTDLRSWTYVNEAYACRETDMIECPDLAEVDGRDLLLFSPTNHPARDDGFSNLHASVYSIGSLDLASGVFNGDEYREIDGGFDFYAPQTVVHPDGRTVMIAWMQMWKRSMPTAEAGLGWAGAMTLPRELYLRDGRLIQVPVREIEAYRRNPVAHRNVEIGADRGGPDAPLELSGVRGSCAEVIVDVDLGTASAVEIGLFAGGDRANQDGRAGQGDRADREGGGGGRRTVLRYDRVAGRVSLDRSRAGIPIQELHRGGAPSAVRSRRYDAADGRLRLRIFLDRSSVEVFLGEGELTLTGCVYPEAGDEGIDFACEGGAAVLTSVEKWDLEARPNF